MNWIEESIAQGISFSVNPQTLKELYGCDDPKACIEELVAGKNYSVTQDSGCLICLKQSTLDFKEEWI